MLIILSLLETAMNYLRLLKTSLYYRVQQNCCNCSITPWWQSCLLHHLL